VIIQNVSGRIILLGNALKVVHQEDVTKLDVEDSDLDQVLQTYFGLSAARVV
jgi:hypothetical protein